MNIIIAILIFTVVVVVHELGHFLLAKKNGVTVTEFSVGMGPRLVTVVKTDKGFTLKVLASQKYYDNRKDWKDHTKYSWKLFPIGGSCMMLGEDEVVEDENAFNKKGVWARISVIFAGPFFNFILALILALIIIGANGYDSTKITSVEKGFPAETAGLKAGDRITKMNNTKVDIYKEVVMYLYFNQGKPIDITYNRVGVKKTVTVTPIKTKEGNYRIGVGCDFEKASAVGVIKYSAIEVKYQISSAVKGLGMLIAGKLSKDDIAGPVGIVDMVGGQIEQSKGYGMSAVLLTILNMCMFISANLGIMNLLPLPALDGGRLVFLFLEVFRRKPIDQEKEGMVHLIGLAALMVLMVFVMFNDISRLIK